MAALESLNFDSDNATHYIHCVLSNVPMKMAVSELAPMIIPQPGIKCVEKLGTLGYRIVPHRLHVFKESLENKFGYATFFLHHTNNEANPEEVHRLILQWVDEDLTSMLSLVKVTISLGQPRACYSSVPFLHALHQWCFFLNPDMAKDTKKLETFLLSKISFLDDMAKEKEEKEEQRTNQDHKTHIGDYQDAKSEEEIKRPVASFSISSLSSKELLWLSREHRSFPPILITNKDISTTKCDKDALHKFFNEALAPFVKVLY